MRVSVKWFGVIAILIVTSPLALPVATEESCASCQPERYGYATNVAGSYVVCIESKANKSFSSAQATAIGNGINDYWAPHLASLNVNITFSFVTGVEGSNACPTHDIKFKLIDPANMVNAGALAEANLTTDARGASVDVNWDELTNSAIDWGQLGAHEIGHLLDYKDILNRPDCNVYSIMSGANQSLPSAMLCGETTALTSRYGPAGSSEDGIEPNDPGEDNCWDYYWVRHYWWFDGQNWHYAGWVWGGYVGTYCEPYLL